jgi:hypothetical protein
VSRKGGLLTSWSAKAEERLVAQAGKKDNLLFEQASHKALAVGKQV